MPFWWGMAVLSAIFAAWLHLGSQASRRPSKHFASLTMTDTRGAMVYLGLAVYVTAAY